MKSMLANLNMKSVKAAAWGVIGLLVIVAIGYSMFNVQNRPIEQVAIYRKCDFISIAGVSGAVCGDGSQWSVTELAVVPTVMSPVVEVPLQPDVRDSDLLGQTLGVQPIEAAPAPAPEPDVTTTAMTVRYSHYWPPAGGPNCSSFVDGVCVSAMASGEPWAPYVGIAVACPPEWEFGTTVELDGHVWTCMDRGGAITYVDGVPWVDFLVATGTYAHGSIVAVDVSHQNAQVTEKRYQ